MPHSNAKIWIHLVFSTKDRMPLITESIEKNLHSHIRRKLTNEFDCFVEEINGSTDHIHILFNMSEKHSLENIVKNIKGESTHWINLTNRPEEKFSWQVGYCAFSISIDKVHAVKTYISRQKDHHGKISFKDEYEKLMKIYSIKD